MCDFPLLFNLLVALERFSKGVDIFAELAPPKDGRGTYDPSFHEQRCVGHFVDADDTCIVS